MAIVNEKCRKNLASRYKKSPTARLVKSKNYKKICKCATLGWHCNTIVNQNINILFLFHFLLSLIFCLSTPLSLSLSLTIPSHLISFFFFFFFSVLILSSNPSSSLWGWLMSGWDGEEEKNEIERKKLFYCLDILF